MYITVKKKTIVWGWEKYCSWQVFRRLLVSWQPWIGINKLFEVFCCQIKTKYRKIWQLSVTFVDSRTAVSAVTAVRRNCSSAAAFTNSCIPLQARVYLTGRLNSKQWWKGDMSSFPLVRLYSMYCKCGWPCNRCQKSHYQSKGVDCGAECESLEEVL